MGGSHGATFMAVCACLLAVCVADAAPPDDEGKATLRRFALIVGSSEGGTGRERLRYAGTDALAMSRVLGDLGGVAPTDAVLLLEASREDLVAALARMRTLADGVPEDGVRRELVLYYSGHSDSEGLLPRGERLSYEELRRLMGEVPVDVRLAILDSCGSGALTRSKGGVKRAAFMEDLSTRVRGHAYLASSSADEVAQESDSIGASFFTHFLVTGLRGAADTSGDGRVTLHEAYQFAFHETLARTERSQGGAQHAEYDIQLAGSGDLVLTDLRDRGTRLTVAEDVEGRLFVRNWGNQLVAELQKSAGRRLVLGLEAGRYHAVLEQRARRFEAELTVTSKGGGVLRADDFVPVTLIRTASRGGSAPEVASRMDDAPRVPLNLSLLPPLSTSALTPGRSANTVALGVLAVRSGELRGVGLAGGLGWVDGTTQGVQVSGLANMAGGELRGLQVALGANLAFEDAQGMQVAGLVNSARGAYRGVQLSAAANRVEAELTGMQGALGVNVAQRMTGLQVGLLNLSDDVTGTQVGLVNVGGVVRGLQLGLLNIADDVTVPIGLLSIVKRGRLAVELSTDDTHPVSVGIKYGSQRVYVLATSALGTSWAGSFRLFTMVGMGVHFPLDDEERYSLDTDVSYGSWQRNFFGGAPSNHLYRLRVTAAWELRRRFALFGGLTVNHYDAPREDEDRGVSYLPQFVVGSGPEPDRLWPGFILGVRI
ncbi:MULTISPECIES: LA_2272 family surface repeat-containing protein [Corallococcus]|uniref:caspase family protein n=1 Tax=Corallococcus TaxID=83461 RepID=UPI00163D44ED|nr:MULTISPECIES: caspase family protein [Corallococcus]